MKKLLVLIMAALMILAMAVAGCGGDDKKLTTAVLHTRRSWLSVPMPISTTLTCKNNRTLPTTLF